MQLQTTISLEPQPHNQIDYNSKLLLLGSCFVENISAKLNYHKFQHTVNPFGILFQPKAIEDLIINAINEKKYSDADVFYLNEQWHTFEAHSKLCNSNKETFLNELNLALQLTRKQITNSSHIVITLGTAWAYRHIETDTLVANCHKVPQKKFIKELLSVQKITNSLEASIALIRGVNSKASILFTISPVRHLKDGFIENNRSKAHLISAVNDVIEPRKNIHYFPGYEIMMDELRDYRFYQEDMVHPNQVAINYIWEKFQHVWVSEMAKETMNEVDGIQKALAHTAFHPDSEQHQKFLTIQKQKMERLEKEFPFMSF